MVSAADKSSNAFFAQASSLLFKWPGLEQPHWLAARICMEDFGGASQKPLSFRGTWPGLPWLEFLRKKVRELPADSGHRMPARVVLAKKGPRPQNLVYMLFIVLNGKF